MNLDEALADIDAFFVEFRLDLEKEFPSGRFRISDGPRNTYFPYARLLEIEVEPRTEENDLDIGAWINRPPSGRVKTMTDITRGDGYVLLDGPELDLPEDYPVDKLQAELRSWAKSALSFLWSQKEKVFDYLRAVKQGSVPDADVFWQDS